ncbi:MAG: cell division protein FtsQ [Lachnospiraceae bacterium]|nr:cell division protein FtsQ [Lachnospiraceae bacterium]
MGKRQRKSKMSPKAKRTALNMLIVIMSVAIVFFALLLIFQTREISVVGTVHSSDADVLRWINQDNLSINSLYIFLRYHNRQTDLPPAVERVTVRLQSPWQVELQVVEKPVYGYVFYRYYWLYFDRNGIASIVTEEPIPDILYIEGLDIDTEEIKLGEMLLVEDESIFNSIRETVSMLNELTLQPDRFVVVEDSITLYFGERRVLLGNRGFRDRVAQIPPIFAELEERYPEQSGTLHLERYEHSDALIRFVPSGN